MSYVQYYYNKYKKLNITFIYFTSVLNLQSELNDLKEIIGLEDQHVW